LTPRVLKRVPAGEKLATRGKKIKLSIVQYIPLLQQILDITITSILSNEIGKTADLSSFTNPLITGTIKSFIFLLIKCLIK
jgi:hypothetical protein